MYKLPHGHAVAVCLPDIWDYMIRHMDMCTDVRGREYLTDVFYQISIAMGCENPKQAIEMFRGMMKDMELANPVSENKEKESKILSTSINPVRLKNNPVQIKEQDAKIIYSSVLK